MSDVGPFRVLCEIDVSPGEARDLATAVEDPWRVLYDRADHTGWIVWDEGLAQGEEVDADA